MAHKKTPSQQHDDFVKRRSQTRAGDTKIGTGLQSLGKGVNVENLDRTFLNFVDKFIDAEVKTNKGSEKVKVLFSSKERWASLRNHAGIRDSQGRLILPLITILRTTNEIDMEATYSELNHISILQKVDSKSIYSKQRYDYEDTQPGLAKPTEPNATRQGPLYDYISFPSPKSIKLTYEVSFWSDYMSQNNSIFESFVNNIERQIHYIFGEDGFYFPVKIVSVSNDSNLEEFSDDERIIRQTISFEVFAYLVDEKKIKQERSAIELQLSQQEISIKKSDAEGLFTKTLGLNRKIF